MNEIPKNTRTGSSECGKEKGNPRCGRNPERKASLQEERVNAEVARTIYELRKQAGLSQKELANRVGTTQSVISRLEDDDYEGHSLRMLNRIAKALKSRVTVRLTAHGED